MLTYNINNNKNNNKNNNDNTLKIIKNMYIYII